MTTTITGPVVSSPLEVSGFICSACIRHVKQAKSDGTPAKWKPLLDTLCGVLKHGDKSKRCQEKVDKYAHDIETKTPLEFCLEIQLP